MALFFHLLLGETSIIPEEYNIFANVEAWPYILRIINGWFAISGIPQYLFWYSLGAIVFNRITKYMEMKETHPLIFGLVGFISGTLSLILFFNNISGFESLHNIIYLNNFTNECYKILCCLIIIVFVIFISKYLEESTLLNTIGKSSMNFMGLEWITHSFFTLTFLPMINLGIPSISSTMHVVTITVIQIAINLWISNRINKYFPVLNGDFRINKN